MPRFSIVVPASMDEGRLSSCLNSIKGQSLDDWEALVIVDGNSDKCSDVAQEYSQADSRFKTIIKEAGEGVGLARRSGTLAANGEWIIYLDGGDELMPDALRDLSNALNEEACDLLRFGIRVDSEAMLQEDDGLKQDWRVWGNALCADVAKKAYRVMMVGGTGSYLEAYELFVLAAFAQQQVARTDIEGYRRMQRSRAMSAVPLSEDEFISKAVECSDAIRAIEEFAENNPEHATKSAAASVCTKLMSSLFDEWRNSVSEQEKTNAAKEVVDIFGAEAVACELERLAGEEAHACCMNDALPGATAPLYVWHELAFELMKGLNGSHRFDYFSSIAEIRFNDLDKARRLHKASGERIKIFVATHRPADRFESDILQPIQVGAAIAHDRVLATLRDDIGDNISELNPYYCELTAQYWAWKNADADYYGLCHYRRYFDFSNTEHRENAWGEIIVDSINERTQREFGLEDDSIRKAIDGFDVITTRFQDLRGFPGAYDTPYEHWVDAISLRNSDLIDIFAILAHRHPEYLPDIEAYSEGRHSCFCNMFVMRKQVFFDYCAWLFPLLEEFMRVTDMTNCSRETMRTPGHLAERLLNIYLMHQKRIGSNLKMKEVQCVHFSNTNRFAPPRPVDPQRVGIRSIVPVVLAANNDYVPMLATTVRSMLDNASHSFFYHVVVLTTDISEDNRRIIKESLEPIAPAAIDFVYVSSLVSEYNLTTSNSHISIETYYRFLIQDVLPYYDKVLYLDSDLIIEGDVSELFATDVESKCLAAVVDVDYLGNYNISAKRQDYTRKVLGMQDPYAYFQAGVLVMNTRELRSVCSVSEWLEIAQNPSYIYNDQDILNVYCEGKVVFLDQAWNVMIDGGRIKSACSHAPKKVFESYLKAREHEKIIHYAGVNKPWTTRTCDREEHYWKYARKTPYYEQLLLMASLNEAKSEARFAIQRALIEKYKPYVEMAMPEGSKRRETIRRFSSRYARK